MKMVLVASAIATLASHEFSVDQNLFNLVVAVAATVAVVVAVIKFVESKIDHKVRNYSQLVKVQFKLLRKEISNLRELMGHPPLPDEVDEEDAA